MGSRHIRVSRESEACALAKDLAYGNGVLILQTAIKEVWLGELTSQDTRAFYELVQRNREHLTQFGDYQELVASALQDIEDYFAAPPR